MKPIKLSEQKPPDEFKYYMAWDAVNQEYLDLLMWRYDYDCFVRTNLRCCCGSTSTVEEQMPNVTHWMRVEDMPIPEADFSVKKTSGIVQFSVVESEAQKLLDLLESMDGVRLAERKEYFDDEIVETVYGVLAS